MTSNRKKVTEELNRVFDKIPIPRLLMGKSYQCATEEYIRRVVFESLCNMGYLADDSEYLSAYYEGTPRKRLEACLNV